MPPTWKKTGLRIIPDTRVPQVVSHSTSPWSHSRGEAMTKPHCTKMRRYRHLLAPHRRTRKGRQSRAMYRHVGRTILVLANWLSMCSVACIFSLLNIIGPLTCWRAITITNSVIRLLYRSVFIHSHRPPYWTIFHICCRVFTTSSTRIRPRLNRLKKLSENHLTVDARMVAHAALEGVETGDVGRLAHIDEFLEVLPGKPH